jgi:diacylglycerol kinase
MKRFIHAADGIIYVFRNEQNFKIHFVAAILVITAGFLCNINTTEWLFIIVAITIVTALELINSAIEYLCNFVNPSLHEKIKRIKDASAGAVLIASIGSLIMALVIFLPKFLHFIIN